MTLSPCHNEPLIASLGDGVMIGSCPICFAPVARINPQTGQAEWLDGSSPWTAAPRRIIEAL